MIIYRTKNVPPTRTVVVYQLRCHAWDQHPSSLDSWSKLVLTVRSENTSILLKIDDSPDAGIGAVRRALTTSKVSYPGARAEVTMGKTVKVRARERVGSKDMLARSYAGFGGDHAEMFYTNYINTTLRVEMNVCNTPSAVWLYLVSLARSLEA